MGSDPTSDWEGGRTETRAAAAGEAGIACVRAIKFGATAPGLALQACVLLPVSSPSAQVWGCYFFRLVRL